ncbi:oxidative stress-induced growth inhibitor 1-like [Paramormyrops kingsleyae]|uniref:oxidative stress-induced growth inhibitor 1-like n=1 Tax=Paramormyrops kingsleyae TaxID=1676925 RepID=UPI003B9780A4
MCDQHQSSEDAGVGLVRQRSSGLHPYDPLPVVIIGNGPSGICLSYLLSGHRPYVKAGASHPNPILHRKLQDITGKCLLEQDLEYLSEGLEGRSHSPLGLLLDALLRPDGDLGGPAETLLAWRREPEHRVTHLVLGKGPVGGAWQVMEPSMVTLSLGEWMELPDLPFRDWIKKRGRQLRNNRATTRDISQYYQHYVQAKSLQEHFCSGRRVTSVRRLPLDAWKDESSAPPSTLFEVQGVWETANGEQSPFCLYAENVVLATGAYDCPRRLGVEGEDPSMVFHTIGDLERALRERHLGPSSDPLLVVGAGLTAADAVLLAHRGSVPILHTFRRAVRDSALVFNQLPPLMFPEYHKVYDMMSQQPLAGGGSYRGYTSLPGHRVLRFHSGGTATLEEGATGKKRVVSISLALVLIGSNPNLSFLPDGGRGLALDPGQSVNAKRNPIDTDSFSYECVQEQGLYALGPLAGDGFVRFLQGGALGVATSLMKKQGLV